MTTTEHKIAMLELYGFTAGDRDPRLNTDYQGAAMVVEANRDNIGEFDLPTANGENGPWCVVGDDLGELIDTAHEYLLGLADTFNKIDEDWTRLSALPTDDIPTRRYTGLADEAVPSPR